MACLEHLWNPAAALFLTGFLGAPMANSGGSSRQWSASTLADGLHNVVNQSPMLQSRSDEDLLKELEATRFAKLESLLN